MSSGTNDLEIWLERKTNWTGADSHNEQMETLYSGVMDKVLASIRKGRGGLFSKIVDETADISNKEQKSICGVMSALIMFR